MKTVSGKYKYSKIIFMNLLISITALFCFNLVNAQSITMASGFKSPSKVTPLVQSIPDLSVSGEDLENNSDTSNIEVLTDINGAILKPEHLCSIDNEKGTVSFNISGGKTLLHVRITSDQPPHDLVMKFYIDPSEAANPQRNILDQGLFVSTDGIEWDLRPFKQESGNWYSVKFTNTPEIRVACDAPYGRENLDRLIALTSNDKHVKIRTLGTGSRTFPLFEYGIDDGKKPIHYIIAGECNHETAAQWAADEMVRYIHANPEAISSVTKDHILRIIPKVSPYSYTHGNGMNLISENEKRNIYAAGTWSDSLPPAEMLHLKNEVLGIKSPTSGPTHVEQKRLHYVFTVHSFKTQNETAEYECVKESHAGKKLIDNTENSRTNWAFTCMDLMTKNFPSPCKKRIFKTWRRGLARDFFLEEFNMITFRLEMTTVNQGLPEFAETGRAIIDNLNNLGNSFDWSYVYPFSQ